MCDLGTNPLSAFVSVQQKVALQAIFPIVRDYENVFTLPLAVHERISLPCKWRRAKSDVQQKVALQAIFPIVRDYANVYALPLAVHECISFPCKCRRAKSDGSRTNLL